MAEPGASELRTALRVGLLGSGVLLFIYFAAWLMFGTPLSFLRPSDDAYYYLDIAVHVVHDGAFTTDGVHDTNGFHPLWLLMLLPLAAVFEPTSQGLVVAAQLMSCILVGVAVAGILAAARRAGVSVFGAIVGAAFVFLSPWLGMLTALLESALLVALLAWSLYAALRLRDRLDDRSATLRDATMFGVLAGLTILARLDSVFVVAAIGALGAFWTLRAPALSPPTGRRLIARACGIPLALLGAYAVVNVLAFGGHLVPVSGEIKSTFPTPDPMLGYLRLFPEYYALLALAGAAALITWRRRPWLAQLLVALTLGGGVHGLYVILFSPRAVFWWYFAALLPGGVLGIAALTDAVTLPQRSRRTRTLVIGTVSAIALVGLLVADITDRDADGHWLATTGWLYESERAGEWASANLPPDALLAMRDSGAFGYYTAQPVMNLDGLASSYEYHEALCDGRLVEELNRSNVRFIAFHAADPDYTEERLGIPCFPSRDTTTKLWFRRDQEVYRSPVYLQHDVPLRYVIWEWDPAGARRPSDSR